MALVSIIVLKVVPQFSDFYGTFNAQLPLITRIIVRVSDVVSSYFLVIVVAIAAAVIAVAAWIRRPGQRARFDRLILRVPMLGQVASKFATSQMARTLATLLGGGLPLVNAVDIAARSIGNQFMAAQLDIVGARVREGESFAAALDARKVFPDVAVKMAEVGESTGALQEMLNTVADFYDEDISTTMERFVTLVEPTLLVVMGIVIAGLLLALYMPLFQLSSVLSQ
jgi:type IV pilus assembly protein PilC